MSKDALTKIEKFMAPGSRVKALWLYRYDHIMKMSKKKSASIYKSKSYYWLQIYTVHNLNLMHHISILYLYKWVKQRYNLLDWLFLINLGKPNPSGHLIRSVFRKKRSAWLWCLWRPLPELWNSWSMGQKRMSSGGANRPHSENVLNCRLSFKLPK